MINGLAAQHAADAFLDILLFGPVNSAKSTVCQRLLQAAGIQLRRSLVDDSSRRSASFTRTLTPYAVAKRLQIWDTPGTASVPAFEQHRLRLLMEGKLPPNLVHAEFKPVHKAAAEKLQSTARKSLNSLRSSWSKAGELSCEELKHFDTRPPSTALQPEIVWLTVDCQFLRDSVPGAQTDRWAATFASLLAAIEHRDYRFLVTKVDCLPALLLSLEEQAATKPTGKSEQEHLAAAEVNFRDIDRDILDRFPTSCYDAYCRETALVLRYIFSLYQDLQPYQSMVGPLLVLVHRDTDKPDKPAEDLEPILGKANALIYAGAQMALARCLLVRFGCSPATPEPFGTVSHFPGPSKALLEEAETVLLKRAWPRRGRLGHPGSSPAGLLLAAIAESPQLVTNLLLKKEVSVPAAEIATSTAPGLVASWSQPIPEGEDCLKTEEEIMLWALSEDRSPRRVEWDGLVGAVAFQAPNYVCSLAVYDVLGEFLRVRKRPKLLASPGPTSPGKSSAMRRRKLPELPELPSTPRPTPQPASSPHPSTPLASTGSASAAGAAACSPPLLYP